MIEKDNKFLQVNKSDNVATALFDIESGKQISLSGKNITIKQIIKAGHKIAIADINQNSSIIKYGFEIGLAKEKINAGDWVHCHNLVSNLGENISAIRSDENFIQKPAIKIKAYRRENNKIGIRNDIWILPTVGCVTNLGEQLAKWANDYSFPNIDNFVCLGHQFGCSQLGDDLNSTKKILQGLIENPNAAAVLLIGLGCENNKIQNLYDGLSNNAKSKTIYYNAQDISDEFEHGKAKIFELAKFAQKFERSECGLDEIVIGLKCGGSDGFSGLSANPLIGRITDEICSQNGTAILTEIPEIFGAEHILLKRCKDKLTFEKLDNLVNEFKNYFISNNQKIYENPSPGNNDGGISSLAEKSLGAVQKGGNAIINDIVQYGEMVKSQGLNILNAPGNDAISSTALAAAGAHLILFSTGRGTPLGFPIPTIKISSNTNLANKKPNWIDFDAGQIFENGFEITQEQLMNKIIEIINGSPTQNEINNNRQIAIWKNGVTL